MLKIIRKWGYEDVMKHIWFCHAPINGKPCGFCHPCEVKMESSMEWLLLFKLRKTIKCISEWNEFLENISHVAGYYIRGNVKENDTLKC